MLLGKISTKSTVGSTIKFKEIQDFITKKNKRPRLDIVDNEDSRILIGFLQKIVERGLKENCKSESLRTLKPAQLKMFYRVVENIIDFHMFFYSFTCKNYAKIYDNL